MKSGKDLSERTLVGTSTLTSGDEAPQSFDEYYLPLDLPSTEKKLEICKQHIREGRASELMEDFVMGGVHFPERDEPQEITTQLSCKGASCILKKCGLTVTQYDSNGEVLSKMKTV